MIKSRLCLHHTGAIREFRWVLGILALVAACLAACVTPNPPPAPTPQSPLKDCVDFEDLTVGKTYRVPATFAGSGAAIQALSYQWSNMNWTNDGRADVMKDGLAGGSDNEMFLNNVNLGFNVGSLECVALRFRDKGGNVNLIINNNVGNFLDFQNVNLGGVTVSVTYDAGGENKGILKLSGEFTQFNFQEKWLISFAIGGQELSIDDICPCR